MTFSVSRGDGPQREAQVFLPLLTDGRLRLRDRAQEETGEVSTCGKEMGKMSSESSRRRERGGEGVSTSSVDALPGPLATEWPGSDCGWQEADCGRGLLGTSCHVL